MIRKLALISLITLMTLTGLSGLLMAQGSTELSIYREETMSMMQYPAGKEMTQTVKTWFRGNKMRTEAADGNDVTIIRPDLDLVYRINMARKVYSEAPLDYYRRAAKLSLAMMAADPTYQFTNRKKKIGQWECREVVIADDSNPSGHRIKTVWWISDEGILSADLYKRLMRVTVGDAEDEVITRFFDKISNLPGYPVEAESAYSRQGTTVKSTSVLKKLEYVEVPAEKFELPKGLTKVNIPTPDKAPF